MFRRIKSKIEREVNMSFTLAIPFLNQLDSAKGSLGTLRHNTSDKAEWLIIDNGSQDKIEEYFYSYLKPKKLNYLRNEENIGMVSTMQQIYENCETEFLAITHSDVFVYEKDWDLRVTNYFRDNPRLGVVGFFGAQGCGPRGERIQDVPSPLIMAGMSNMLEAEKHGMRINEPWRSCAIVDGFMMIMRMKMLKRAGGFDQRYQWHHFYDRSVCLQSLALGYQNIVVNVPCHHWSGMTANRSEYQLWINKKLGKENADSFTHDSNMELFGKIWGKVLPVYVDNSFNFRTGNSGQWNFKGDQIVSFDWKKQV